jgi:hypothetical protein
LWAVLLLSPPAPAQPVLIYLNNGDRLSGVIVSETTNSLVMSNAWNREIILPLNQIVWRTAPPALPPAPPPLQAASSGPAPTNAAAAPPAAAPPAPAVAKAPPPPPAPRPKHWSGEAQVGLSVVQNTTSRQVYYGNARVAYANGRVRDTTDINGSYGRTDGTVDADQAALANKLDYDMNPRWYNYLLAGVGFDKIRKIDLHYEAGPGVGWRASTAQPFILNLEAGFDYQVEERSDDADLQRCYGRLSENGTWKLTSRLSMDHRLAFYPGLSSLDEFRFRGEVNMRYLLAGNLSLNLALVESYDTTPAAGVPPNELQFRSFVGVKF